MPSQVSLKATVLLLELVKLACNVVDLVFDYAIFIDQGVYFLPHLAQVALLVGNLFFHHVFLPFHHIDAVSLLLHFNLQLFIPLPQIIVNLLPVRHFVLFLFGGALLPIQHVPQLLHLVLQLSIAFLLL
jgi:hypothetical protein